METSGPGAGRALMGPMRRLLFAREVPRPPVRSRLLSYAIPLTLLPLIGLSAAAGEYLLANRSLAPVAVWAIAAGTVQPALLAYTRPVIAWRVAFLMMFVGTA